MMNIFSCRNIFWYRSGFYFRICFLFGSGFCFRIRIPILGMNRNQLKVWFQVRRCRRRKVKAGFASDSTDFCDCEYCSLFASTCIMVEEMERLRTGACKKPEIRILRVKHLIWTCLSRRVAARPTVLMEAWRPGERDWSERLLGGRRYLSPSAP
jgi:hypothetical protein